MKTRDCVLQWLAERRDNCKRIGATKDGFDRIGWLDDAKYFQCAITMITSVPDDIIQSHDDGHRAALEEIAVAVAAERKRCADIAWAMIVDAGHRAHNAACESVAESIERED